MEIPDSGVEDIAAGNEVWITTDVIDSDIVAETDSVMVLLPVSNDVSMEDKDKVITSDVSKDCSCVEEAVKSTALVDEIITLDEDVKEGDFVVDATNVIPLVVSTEDSTYVSLLDCGD